MADAVEEVASAASPYVLLAKVGAVVGIAAGLWIWGHHVGYSNEKAQYDLYKSQQTALAEKQVIQNKDALKAAQDSYASGVAAIQKDHSDEVTKLTNARDAAAADRDHYAGQLRKYLASASVGKPQLSGSSSGTGQPAAEGSGGLSDGVSSLNWYLTQRFYTADVNAAALNEAIDIIAKDRALCNGKLPGVSN